MEELNRHGQDIMDEIRNSGADEGSVLELILFEDAAYRGSNASPPNAKGYEVSQKMKRHEGLHLVGYLVEINNKGQIEMATSWDFTTPNYDIAGFYVDARAVHSFNAL